MHYTSWQGMALFMKPVAIICLHGSHTVPCKVPLMHAHCLDPMHTLLLPISRNSILLLRPNHQILFPGNFYPFMLLYNVCDEDESNDNVAEQISEKKSSLSFSPFQAIFPGFISKSSRVENSILKEKWRGGGESWMKKEGGLRGYNPTTSKKSQSFSYSFAFHVYHFHEWRFSPKSVTAMMKMRRIWPVMDELLINIWFECVLFHRLSSPFFRLVFATLLAL